jgi:glycosyltransferase involved in cell wall biosynthesis
VPGISVVEAIEAGLPVIAARTGGSPELSRDGVEAAHWPLDDPESGPPLATLIASTKS